MSDGEVLADASLELLTVRLRFKSVEDYEILRKQARVVVSI
jgi:hypothetical protein